MYNIYVAEDNPLQVELIRAAFSSIKDYEVSFFGNGLELYQKVQAEKPHLLILDIILPNLTGLAVSRLLKFHEHFREIPILIMSSITDQDIKERVESVGADRFLPKPFRIDEFMNAVEELLSSH